MRRGVSARNRSVSNDFLHVNEARAAQVYFRNRAMFSSSHVLARRNQWNRRSRA